MTGIGAWLPELAFPGDSEMARRMRAHPWAGSALGEPRDWPPTLRTACRICLTSRFPMIVWWGPELRFLYNDAYRPLLGSKHPALGKPGREVWGDIWDVIGPMLDSVLGSGQATWSQDLRLRMNRHGYWEETYFTYSYSPLQDDTGAVRGVFTAVSETTERVIGERRLAVLRELAARAGSARSVAEACELVTVALAGAGPDIPFAAAWLRDAASGELELAASSPAGVPPAALAAGPDGWPAAEVARTGRPARLTDVAARFGDLPAGGWTDPPSQALVLPLTGEADGPAAGVIALAASAGRALDPAYEAFLALVAQQVAALIGGAVAYQAQQRRAEELAELDRAKTAFFSNISHEFRTPLTLITGPLAELQGRLAGQDAAVREDLAVIERNSLRLGRLVNALLEFSRIEAGRMQARFAPADLAALTTDLASLFRSAMQRAGLAFEVDAAPLAEPAYVDPQMWETIVLNLLSNALKFTFDGSVRVTLRQEGRQAVLRVADTGTGVPAAEMPRLFERFHRVASARARSNEGSGIGLAMAAELVALHGGTIMADSAAGPAPPGGGPPGPAGIAGQPGPGTVFTVTLPLGRDHLPAGALAAPAEPAPAGPLSAEAFIREAERWLPGSAQDGDSGAPPAPEDDSGPPPGVPASRVLLADDNADMREYLERLLAPGYQVQAVADGRAALAAVRASPPDLVISDVMMPSLDGLGLVAALRAAPATAGVPVLLLSARAGQESAIEGLDAGADDYLVKPFAAAELLARVRGILRLASLRGQHVRQRETALAAMGAALSQAASAQEAIAGTAREIGEVWQAREVLAVAWGHGAEPAVTSVTPAAGPVGRAAGWASLPATTREAVSALRGGPLLQPSAMPGAVGIALEHPGGQLVLRAELDPARPLSSEDQALLTQLCGYLVQALHRIHQAGQQRETALALQRAILGPARLPAGFAARYEPAARPLEVGGDWYDIIDLPGGRTGLVVGDCVGHGLAAATVMGQLRSACRALLLREASPARALVALDDFAARLPGAPCSTVFCGILDPATGQLTYSSAGHPPGIVAAPDGAVRLLDGGRAPSLAVEPATARADAQAALPGRSTILLYTDGLVERRYQSIDTGIALAGQAVAAGRSDPAGELADRLMPGLAPDGGYPDDVALLLFRYPLPLRLAFPARTGELGPARAGLRGWLSRCDLTPAVLQGVLVAAGEACANAIEHGARGQGRSGREPRGQERRGQENGGEGRPAGGTARIELTAAATATGLRLTVTDTGSWRDPGPDRGAYRGHGIPLMEALMSEVTIVPGETGTTVEMQLRIAP